MLRTGAVHMAPALRLCQDCPTTTRGQRSMKMARLVLGALHGGWWFEPLARELRRWGRGAYPLAQP